MAPHAAPVARESEFVMSHPKHIGSLLPDRNAFRPSIQYIVQRLTDDVWVSYPAPYHTSDAARSFMAVERKRNPTVEFRLIERRMAERVLS